MTFLDHYPDNFTRGNFTEFTKDSGPSSLEVLSLFAMKHVGIFVYLITSLVITTLLNSVALSQVYNSKHPAPQIPSHSSSEPSSDDSNIVLVGINAAGNSMGQAVPLAPLSVHSSKLFLKCERLYSDELIKFEYASGSTKNLAATHYWCRLRTRGPSGIGISF